MAPQRPTKPKSCAWQQILSFDECQAPSMKSPKLGLRPDHKSVGNETNQKHKSLFLPKLCFLVTNNFFLLEHFS